MQKNDRLRPRSRHGGSCRARGSTIQGNFMTESRDPMAPDGAVNPIDTDYKVGQDNILVNVGPFGLDIHNRVFAVSGLLVVAFVVLTLVPNRLPCVHAGPGRSSIARNCARLARTAANLQMRDQGALTFFGRMQPGHRRLSVSRRTSSSSRSFLRSRLRVLSLSLR